MKKAILVGLSILVLSLNTSCGKDDGPTPEPQPMEVGITGFSPTSGEVGTEVTISGKNFSTTKTENSVSFNGTAATVKEASASQLKVNVPSGATTGSIKVTVGNNSTTSTTSFEVLTPADPPTVDGFEPTYGVIGTEVTITGTNFGDQASVKFGDKVAEVTDVTATQLIVTVPNGAETAPINITVGSQSVTTSDDFTVYDPTSLTLTPDADYVQNPSFEIGEILWLEISGNAPSGLDEFVVTKTINDGEPILEANLSDLYSGFIAYGHQLGIVTDDGTIGDNVEITVSVKGVADIAHATQTFSYTVAAQGQGGSGGKYPKLMGSSTNLGSQGNNTYGSYYSSSANTVYDGFDGVSEEEQAMVDITFGTILNIPNLISPDERANKGLDNFLGTNATNTTFKNEGNALDFYAITSTDVALIDHSEGAVSNLLIAEGVYYSFVNASEKKGYIKVNIITDYGGNDKEVHISVLVQE
jgi:hypothetical protein